MRVVAGDAWHVYLDGEIDSRASLRLAAELSRNNVQQGVAFLNSPGGNLLAGLEIGRLLRKHGLSTYIRRRVPTGDLPGQCLSACVYAFVGGYFRYFGNDDILGVHRFSRGASSPRDLDIAQIVSGSIIAYLTEMGVDVQFFHLTTRIGQDEIYRLSPQEARKMRVANNGRQPAKWSIEAVDEGLYLLGTQEAWYGLGKVTFVCGQRGVIFYPFYSAGSNSANIVQATVRHSIRLGGDFIDIGKPLTPLTSNNGVVSATFVLPPTLVERIKVAHSVGYAAHLGNPDLFAGFTVEIGEHRQKIASYFNQCASSQRK